MLGWGSTSKVLWLRGSRGGAGRKLKAIKNNLLTKRY